MQAAPGPRLDDDEGDAAAEEEAYFASLGLPDYDTPVVRPTPYDSRIGGAATWFPGKAEHGKDGGVCASCGAQLFMVAQIYAPVEYARALAIFGCNNLECSRKASSWRVLRTQDVRDVDPWRLGNQAESGEQSGGVCSASKVVAESDPTKRD